MSSWFRKAEEEPSAQKEKTPDEQKSDKEKSDSDEEKSSEQKLLKGIIYTHEKPEEKKRCFGVARAVREGAISGPIYTSPVVKVMKQQDLTGEAYLVETLNSKYVVIYMPF